MFALLNVYIDLLQILEPLSQPLMTVYDDVMMNVLTDPAMH